MRRPDLAAIQRWMQAAIVTPEERDPETVERLIRPSPSMTPAERVDVYSGMYDARLTEALRADFPALADLLGDSLFGELASIYVREHPSRDYTLNELGEELPHFLELLDGLPTPGYTRDLARLEWAIARVFDERETPSVAPERIAAVPAEAWSGAVIRPIAAFRLLELQWPAHEYVAAIRQGGSARPPRRRRNTWLAVYRRDYAVTWIVLEQRAWRVLSSIATGRSLAGSLGAVRDPAAAFEWFRQWNAAGLFQSIEHGGDGTSLAGAG